MQVEHSRVVWNLAWLIIPSFIRWAGSTGRSTTRPADSAAPFRQPYHRPAGVRRCAEVPPIPHDGGCGLQSGGCCQHMSRYRGGDACGGLDGPMLQIAGICPCEGVGLMHRQARAASVILALPVAGRHACMHRCAHACRCREALRDDVCAQQALMPQPTRSRSPTCACAVQLPC